jgi:hypothetical protein
VESGGGRGSVARREEGGRVSAGGLIAIASLSMTDRLKSVRDLLVSKGVIETTRIFLGTQHASLEGDGRQVTFVPTGATPSAAPLEMSNKEGGSNLWECTAHIWAVNADDDYGFDQFGALETLITELQGALRIVGGGRFKMGPVQVSDTTRVLKYGENATFPFSFNVNFQMVPATEALEAGPTTTTAAPRVTP